jgi:tetraacyldisaccharide 4'-kinase
VSSAFRLILHAREKLYTAGILSTMRLNHPVISIGNLTLGGTGKTPLVIALAEGLKSRGRRPVILSRGYGRQNRDIVIAASNWQQAGDEPCLMAQRLHDVPVVVGADRYESGLLAERRQLGNIFILDDGFQHRRLHRDFDIVTVDPAEWNAGEALLPTGRWREPKAAITRAQAACVQAVAGTDMPALPIPTFIVQTHIDGLFRKSARVPVEELKDKQVVAFAGIAKPERFFQALRSIGINPVRTLSFGDHHAYSRRDIEQLRGDVLVTTEKDAVRLAGLEFPDFVYLRVSAKIANFEQLLNLILERLRGAKGKCDRS